MKKILRGQGALGREGDSAFNEELATGVEQLTYVIIPHRTISKFALKLIVQKEKPDKVRFFKYLAATYSRGGYTTTTIGNAAFDGRVRNGIGSDRSFVATKKIKELNSSQKTTHIGQINIVRVICFIKKQSSLTTD